MRTIKLPKELYEHVVSHREMGQKNFRLATITNRKGEIEAYLHPIIGWNTEERCAVTGDFVIEKPDKEATT